MKYITGSIRVGLAMLINSIRSNDDRGERSIYGILRIVSINNMIISMLTLIGGNLGVRYGRKKEKSA